MKWSIGSKIGTAFALALAALIVVGAVSYDSTTKLIDSADWVAHTHQVLNAAEDVLSTLKDSETGQRGYIITGEESYLQPYQGTREAVERRLKDLRALTSDNPIMNLRRQKERVLWRLHLKATSRMRTRTIARPQKEKRGQCCQRR